MKRVASSLSKYSDADSLVIDPVQKSYMRTTGSERLRANQSIKLLYGGIPEYTEIVSSGMNAIQIVMLAIIDLVKTNPERNLMMFSNELYCDTAGRTVRHLKENGIVVIEFEQSDYDSTVKMIQANADKLVGIFLESCSNPHGKLTDWKIFDNIPVECHLIVDNTWLSPVVFNPFNTVKRVDIVVESCTKYLSGSTVIAGHISCRHKWPTGLHGRIQYFIKLLGIHVSPTTCTVLADQLETIHQRVKSSLSRTREILQSIDLTTIPGHRIFNSGLVDQTFRSSVILFEIPMNNPKFTKKNWRDEYAQLIQDSKIDYQTSYGKPHDAICNFPQRSKDGHIMIRLAVGFENSPIDGLCSKLQKIAQTIYMT